MVEDWSALIVNMNGAVRELRGAAPEILKSFGQMAVAAHHGDALDGKTKELIALAVSVATRCAPCIAYHAEGAVKAAPRARLSPRLWRWRSTWGPALRSCMPRRRWRRSTRWPRKRARRPDTKLTGH